MFSRSRTLLPRLEPQGATVVDRNLLAGFDPSDRDELQGKPGMVAIDAGKRAGGMVAQGDETEPPGAASFAIGVAVPMKIVVVDDGAAKRRTAFSRHNTHRRRLDNRPRRSR